MTRSPDQLPTVPEHYELVEPAAKPNLGLLYATAGVSAAGGVASDAAARALPALRKSPLGKVLPGSLLHRGGDRLRASLDLPRVAHVVEGLVVEPEWHEKFCRVVHARPRSLAPGSSETAVFSGALHSVAFPVAMSVLTRQDFPLPVMGMVHLTNTVQHVMDVAVGEELTATAWTENLRSHRAGTVVDAVVTLTRTDGTVAWAGRSGYLAKGLTAAIAGEDARTGEDEPISSSLGAPFNAPQQTAQWSLRADTGRQYAGVSGDYNPIHLSGASAKALGMKGAIAHGMYTASRALAATAVPAEVPFSWSVEFAAPVVLPATVSVSVHDHGRREHWESSRVIAWDPERNRPHLELAVEPL
ncbi:hypothetical protein IEE92_08995 [Kocuria sp. cx-116]|uniref:MaoC family dehydratase n=1 Tax=Kocuria sp. cx-116 TaxID=2771378 RepID=UPI0016876662|nr:MaoC/PaaZ C-terminal domain-containing protein [Kocuria sp. cx-116]MBD2762683.1 hypothetical protein [Kocuria sp. cx-116]